MEFESGDNVYVPQVNISVIPHVGQEFESSDEAYNFYNQYAHEAGFSIRIENSKKNKETNEYFWKLFVCYKEGKTNETYQMSRKHAVPWAGERNRGHVRCGCNARLSVVKQQNGERWVVSKFVEEHNHPLATPSRVHLLRSHRGVSKTKKTLMQQFSDANIPTCQQVRLLEIDAGGPSSLGCVEKDIRNYQRDVRQEMMGHDAQTLIEYFTFEKEKNPNFVFYYEIDDENKFVRCFWADCDSRRSYAYFGDVVVFDTTYNTNRYSMVFGPFVGVNHHGQTVIFGCGLLSDETTESFVWLFTKFIEAMPNHAVPGVIITDQDAAIARAISMVFPSTLHRFCMWHILNKFSEKMNVVLYNDQYHRLVHIIKQSESPAEFEQQWIEIMETTELGNNEWLSSLFEIRNRWVPAYVKHVFAAGMSSSQRSESGHSFLKKYVNKKNSLTDFVTRFNRALVHQRHEELAANHIDLTQTPKVTTTLMMENQMVQIYTKKIFLLFQNELVQSNSYICSKRSSSNEAKVWTKNAKQARVFDPTTGSYVHIDPGHSLMSRHCMLSYAASDLVDEGSLTDARSTFLLSEFQSLRIRVKDIDTRGNVGMSRNRNSSLEETQVVCDPNPVRAKGCGKRLKSGKDKALSQSNRQCRASGTSGHDRRTCPTLQNSLFYAYHAGDSQYEYHAPDPQYEYHAPDPQYAYHSPDQQYAYYALDPQYSITGSNNASYSLDSREYDARFNPCH
ncbi:Protein FAR1-RELATED SEQUENCE 5 [Abeliophyllum distichum]|uniref:Protein FAR1-RELATED SEQUENCE 5 n=1 Tax=Abeliophyllum distichum TaxID=126358 RepID=A0ABD1TH20_9LAMI